MSGLYFAYGSNLDEVQMRSRCPTARGLERARLPRHRLAFTHYAQRWQGGAADVVADAAASVWGVVYEMGPDDLALLDRFEGGYARVSLAVLLDGREPLQVTSYAVREKGRFPPHPAYLEKMLRWGARWRLPGEYLSEMVERARP
ncbi:MAG TPA: gamma-glutamylcyclotransferase family protein [Myxococcota bacterium]|nr:gamma-glutamylcyclotransferase family protein [Myxococcota bacterium]